MTVEYPTCGGELSEGDRRLIRQLVDEARRRPDDETPSAIAIAGRAAPWVDAERPEPVVEFIRQLAAPDVSADEESPGLEAWA